VFTLIISPSIGGISFNGILAVWPIAVIMVLSQAFGNVLFFKGMEKLDAGSTQIAFSSILMWGAILSVLFLNSNFSALQIIGIFVVMFAIIFNAYRKDHKNLALMCYI
jgi:drug/metabolite transporter (DMT)-like permease